MFNRISILILLSCFTVILCHYYYHQQKNVHVVQPSHYSKSQNVYHRQFGVIHPSKIHNHHQHRSSAYTNPSYGVGGGYRQTSGTAIYVRPPFQGPYGQIANHRTVIIKQEEEQEMNMSRRFEKRRFDNNDVDSDDDDDDDDDDQRNFINRNNRNNNNFNGNQNNFRRPANSNNINNNNNNIAVVDKNRNQNRNQVNTNRNQNGFIDSSSSTASIQQCRTRNGGFPGICVPKGQCYYLYGDLRHMAQEQCRTVVKSQAVIGVCCPLDIDFTPNRRENIPYRLSIPAWPRRQLRISRSQIQQATQKADADIVRFFEMEELFVGRMGQVQVAFTPAHFLQAMFGPADQNQQLLNLWGFRALQVTRSLGAQLDLSPLEMRDGLSQITMHGTSYEQYCIQAPECPNARYRYRTVDGSCNNVANPLWGKSLTQFNRLLPPEYSDGISELRISVNGRPLPAPRVVSTRVFETSNANNARNSNRWNVMFMQWGQFLDHDITLGSSTRASTGQGLLCCNRTDAQGPLIHPACRPIYLPVDDPFYGRLNRQCNNFVRNAVGPKNGCNIGYREQTNVVTSFIDASMIYGNDFNRSRFVRSFENGLLNTAQINGNEWLPFDTMNNSLACSIPQRERNRNRCVFAGDVRVNQQFGLIALQLLFLREHNRLARVLTRLNPRWDDETLYQEARRIVSAIMQHITYNEFLPEALGRNVMRRYQISLQPTGHCLGYDPSVNPSILNEFASAAYRWHTLVQKFYHMRGSNGRDSQRFEMHRIFNNPTTVYGQGALDQTIRGVVAHPTERFDRIFTEDVKNLLFAQPGRGQLRQTMIGMDLMAINIQRGRDHGVPTYNQIRKLCGLQPVTDFRQLAQILTNRDDWQRLSQVYNHVDDIDYWVAGNLERAMDEGLLGPTFSCIVGEQFRRLKFGDRFWYENGEMAHSFNDRQLNEIRKVTLAGIICQNSDDIRRIQPLAMLTISEQNPELDCSLIPQMELTPWQALNGGSNGNDRGGTSGSNSVQSGQNGQIRRGQSRRTNTNRGFSNVNRVGFSSFG